jgi:cytochrome c5
MQARHLVSTLISAVLLCASITASAYDADWKRGRIYYRSVCTACHAAQAGGSIAPSTMTKAEWVAYLQKDKHAKGKDSLKQYVSKPYRASIRTQNKAADKFADLPDEELIDDLKAFVIKGAKDGDTPASCS